MSESFEVEQGGDGFEGEAESTPEAHGMQKAGPACGICCLGMFLFPLALFLLGKNEKDFVCHNKQLIYAKENVKESKCDKALEGIVFFSCNIDEDSLHQFDGSTFHTDAAALKLLKPIEFKSIQADEEVEMYQCRCDVTSTTSGKGKNKKTTKRGTWKTAWSKTIIATDSTEAVCATDTAQKKAKAAANCPNFEALNFQNPNFPSNIKDAKKYTAKDTKAGVYQLTSTMQSGFVANEKLKTSDLATDPSKPFTAQKPIQNVKRMDDTNSGFYASGGVIYASNCNSGTNEIGCVRISWNMNKETFITGLASSKIDDSTKQGVLTAADSPASWMCSADTMEYNKHEELTKDKFLAALEADMKNNLLMFRIGGVLFAWAAVYCCFYPFIAAADILQDYMSDVPCVGGCLGFVGGIVEGLVTVVVCCMSCSLGCSCAFFVMAVTWCVMVPAKGALYLGICVVMFAGVFVVKSLFTKKQDPPMDEES